MKKTWLDQINRIPPVFCRIVARTGRGHNCRPLTTDEISERSGLHRDQVREISKLTKWNKMAAKNIEAFASACGVDLLRTRDHVRYLRSKSLAHIQNATPTQKRSLASLICILKTHALRVTGER